MAKRILIIQLRQLGDILLTTPVCQALKHHDPQIHLTFLTHKMGKKILQGHPFCDEVLFYHEGDSIRDHVRLLRSLRGMNFDLAFDFMDNPRSAWFALASGARRRVGFRSARSLFYSEAHPKQAGDRYIVDEKLALVVQAGIPVEQGRWLPHIPFDEHDHGPLDHLLSSPWRDPKQIRVVFASTHRRTVRKWREFPRLNDALFESHGIRPVWLWGPGEHDEVRQEIASCQHPGILAPKTSFSEMAALLANADLFIGNSNGPSHVAVAADCPSLQLHGHTNVISWCPMRRGHRAVQSAEFGLKAMPTMLGISMDAVMNEVTSLLSETRDRKSRLREARVSVAPIL